jgi:uncharacterized protein YbcI
MASPGEVLKGGALNAAISNAVVGLLSEYVGKGPTKARAIHSGKFVLCVLEDTMTKAERSLASDGKEDFVLSMRHAFQETMREDFVAAVERLTGRKVVAFLSSNHVDPDLAAELFVLDEPITGGVEVVGPNSHKAQEQTSTMSASLDGQPSPSLDGQTAASPDGQTAASPNGQPSASPDGQRRVTGHAPETRATRGAPQPQLRQGADRWLDDGGSFSSGAVARSRPPNG